MYPPDVTMNPEPIAKPSGLATRTVTTLGRTALATAASEPAGRCAPPGVPEPLPRGTASGRPLLTAATYPSAPPSPPASTAVMRLMSSTWRNDTRRRGGSTSGIAIGSGSGAFTTTAAGVFGSRHGSDCASVHQYEVELTDDAPEAPVAYPLVEPVRMPSDGAPCGYVLLGALS